MQQKLKTTEGKQIYRQRKMTVEPVFGIIKEAMGFRRFSLNGKEAVLGEWSLVCSAYNLKRLFSLVTQAKKEKNQNVGFISQIVKQVASFYTNCSLDTRELTKANPFLLTLSPTSC